MFRYLLNSFRPYSTVATILYETDIRFLFLWFVVLGHQKCKFNFTAYSFGTGGPWGQGALGDMNLLLFLFFLFLGQFSILLSYIPAHKK